MTSKVPGSSPGGSGVFFSLFRQFTSPTDPFNISLEFVLPAEKVGGWVGAEKH